MIETVCTRTALVLSLHLIVPEPAVIDAQALLPMKMPDRNGLVDYSHK